MVRLARSGDGRTLDLLAGVGRYLGKGVSVIANLLNPEVVILGGYYVPLAPWLLPAVAGEMQGRTIAPDSGAAMSWPPAWDTTRRPWAARRGCSTRSTRAACPASPETPAPAAPRPDAPAPPAPRSDVPAPSGPPRRARNRRMIRDFPRTP
nr:hypothetical protein GCM10020093_091210 [Planobispora longispora]